MNIEHDEPIRPRTAAEAHRYLRDILDESLRDERSVTLVSMKELPSGVIDVKHGVMNSKYLEASLFMLAYAVVDLNRKSKNPIAVDLRKLGEFVGRIIA